MKILKETGTHMHENRLISKFYVDQSDKIRLDHRETGNVKIGEEL
jgi:hypothetical protein